MWGIVSPVIAVTSAFALAGLRDAVGNRAIVGDAKDDAPFAPHQAGRIRHESYPFLAEKMEARLGIGALAGQGGNRPDWAGSRLPAGPPP